MWGWVKALGKVVVKHGPAVLAAVVEKRIKGKAEQKAARHEPR